MKAARVDEKAEMAWVMSRVDRRQLTQTALLDLLEAREHELAEARVEIKRLNVLLARSALADERAA